LSWSAIPVPAKFTTRSDIHLNVFTVLSPNFNGDGVMLCRLAAFVFRFDFGDIIDVAPDDSGLSEDKDGESEWNPSFPPLVPAICDMLAVK
jgi:hypothetical protein